jgi:hypothetical protein
MWPRPERVPNHYLRRDTLEPLAGFGGATEELGQPCIH